MITKLRKLNVARHQIGDDRVVLRFRPDKSLIVTKVPRFQTTALNFYFRIESQYSEDDVVLVSASGSHGIRSAYRNYFSDTTEFLDYIDQEKDILLK